MRLFILSLLVMILYCCNGPVDVPVKQRAQDGETAESQYKKELEEIRKGLKSEIRIKLKKDGKGSYSWEIAGKDPQEVLRANETLRKKLGDQ